MAAPRLSAKRRRHGRPGVGKVIGDRRPTTSRKRQQGWLSASVTSCRAPIPHCVRTVAPAPPLTTVPYNPPRHPTKLDPTGARIEPELGRPLRNRNGPVTLACVGYLDGVHPAFVCAVLLQPARCSSPTDWRDGKLTQRWISTATTARPATRNTAARARTGLSVADVAVTAKTRSFTAPA